MMRTHGRIKLNTEDMHLLDFVIVLGNTVEERTPPENEGVGDVRVGLLAARVEDDIPVHPGHHQSEVSIVSTNHSSPGHHQVPLPVGHVVAQVGRVARDQQIQLEYRLKNISEHLLFGYAKS